MPRPMSNSQPHSQHQRSCSTVLRIRNLGWQILCQCVFDVALISNLHRHLGPATQTSLTGEEATRPAALAESSDDIDIYAPQSGSQRNPKQSWRCFLSVGFSFLLSCAFRFLAAYFRAVLGGAGLACDDI